MHLFTIAAFALLFWRSGQPALYPLVPQGDVWGTLGFILIPLVAVAALSRHFARKSLQMLNQQLYPPQSVQLFYHRWVLWLRSLLLASLGVAVLCTHWLKWLSLRQITPALQIIGDLASLVPFFVGVTLIWIIALPVENRIRAQVLGSDSYVSDMRHSIRSPFSYVLFLWRNQILVFAVPLALILFASEMAGGYQAWLIRVTGLPLMPDVVVGVAAGLVFLIAPVLLRHIWHTEPLPPGPLRERLEEVCRRINLRVRDILIWKTDGLIINAAVIGLVAPLRYVLLSDGLLASLNARQVEAVFGHEAGHVRHRHILLFLLFAWAGWLIAVAVMEVAARFALEPGGGFSVSPGVIQGIGFGVTVLIWGIGFGWVSRRFERQADLYGAGCVSPAQGDCTIPCSVHAVESRGEEHRVCATGAAIFASALDRVAVLNGIPHEEPSWRHSSIGSRIRFLAMLAGDPAAAQQFSRVLRGIRWVLVALVVVGSMVALYYYLTAPSALMRMQGWTTP